MHGVRVENQVNNPIAMDHTQARESRPKYLLRKNQRKLLCAYASNRITLLFAMGRMLSCNHNNENAKIWN